MIELLSDPAVWAAFATLTVMEIVLGIDNIVFISVLVSRLPKEQADRARRLGLALALIFRIALLLVISWIIGLQAEVFNLFGHGFSWKDLILIGGGLFLIYKATHEMHAEIEEPHEADLKTTAKAAFSAIIAQIIVIDMVFSIDSIITAVGMAEQVEVMIAAVVVAVGVMFVASGPIAGFVARHPTTKMLALAFLLLIGVSLVADGFGFHIEKGYIYAAMGFSVLVEAVNILAKNRKAKRSGAVHHTTPGNALREEVTGAHASVVAAAPAGGTPSIAEMAAAPKARPKSTPSTRAQSRPKSAPRKKP
ncbi:MAG TPA: TerC family protein [Devosia sp.]|jgi:predicted tellurium resistance membrane protein TerC|nr:TerC family protein [Devosia sp.]